MGTKKTCEKGCYRRRTGSREGGDKERELVREDEGLGHDMELLREASTRGHEPAISINHRRAIVFQAPNSKPYIRASTALSDQQ